MRAGSLTTSLLALVSIGLMTACVVEHDHGYGYGEDDPYPESTNGSEPTVVAADAGTSSATALPEVTAVVDTGKTLDAQPGQGVGVFIEYAAGGHWHIWWTCDTATTQQTCAFGNTFSLASAGTGTGTDGGGGGGGGVVDEVTNFMTQGNASLVTDSGGGYLVTSTTGATTIDGVTFDTPPGATIQIIASLGNAGLSEETGKYFFFVQNGQINGGYMGTLTDPLLAVGSAP